MAKRWAVYGFSGNQSVGMVTETPTGPTIDTQDTVLRFILTKALAQPAMYVWDFQDGSIVGTNAKWVQPGDPEHVEAVMERLMSATGGKYSARMDYPPSCCGRHSHHG